MHFTLDGKGVSVYTSPPKDKRLVCLRHFLDHFRADRTHDFAVRYTGEVICKDILEPVFFISRFAEYILVQNVGYKVGFQPARVHNFFIVLADIFEHLLDAVRDLIGVIDRREIAPAEPLVEETVLYALFPPVPLGTVILMLF